MKVDVIILTKTVDQHQFLLTNNAIISLMNSESDHEFNIIIMESADIDKRQNMNYIFSNIHYIEPQIPFNYNAYLNIGLSYCKNDYVVFSNNDLIFDHHWFTNIYEGIVSHQLDVASPLSPSWWRHINMPLGVIEGYENGILFSPWCTVYSRKAIDLIAPLDERFAYWYQDDDIIQTIKSHGLKHALVSTSKVEHLGSQSAYLIGERISEFCLEPASIFNQKWFSKPLS